MILVAIRLQEKNRFFSKFEELMNYTDLLLFDIKHIDTVQHKKLTKHGNENILEMAQYLSEIGKPVWIRHVLVPFRSDYDEFLDRLNQFIQSLSNVDKVEILPYHTMGRYKWDELNIKYPLEGIEPPGQDRVENAKKILQVDQYTGYQTR
ncbi:pyruvate formate-lyase activating enzyme [Tetragenococcus muriaticus PMC-11-5]|uniref:Pyruvate formate-lyase activating enzyme n=1 Tax=Tetragenococcus muriaticus PMC-11-5 TaxID=1302649 RepID=A0A091C4P6_9ENTE|nr:pyruvate formate-lyase activating enzyme [Tetragenococcus muriaticus PMC-11-5]